MRAESWSHITLQSRRYALPQIPTVVICVDGFEPGFDEKGIESGILPSIAFLEENGFYHLAQSYIPTFTNPMEMSTTIGDSHHRNGVMEQHYLDPEAKEEQLMMDDTLPRGTSILPTLARRGVRVAAITAEDKRRRILALELS